MAGAELSILFDRAGPVPALCRRFGVSRLDLFGSAASGGFDPARSDVDLLVEFRPVQGLTPLQQYMGLADALESLLGRRVDLVEPHCVQNPFVRRSIASTRKTVYAAA